MNPCIAVCMLLAITPSGNVITLERNLTAWTCHAKFIRERNAIVDVYEMHPEMPMPEIKCVEQV